MKPNVENLIKVRDWIIANPDSFDYSTPDLDRRECGCIHLAVYKVSGEQPAATYLGLSGHETTWLVLPHASDEQPEGYVPTTNLSWMRMDELPDRGHLEAVSRLNFLINKYTCDEKLLS